MGKSAKIYKRPTRKERKIQASTSAALSSPLSSSSSPATSAATRAQKEPTTATPSVTSKVTKTAQKNSPALIAIKRHESAISNSILRSLSSSEAASLIKDTRKPLVAETTKGSNKDDDVMDTDATISEGKKKKRIDGVKAKARRRGEKDLRNRPDYVDIYSGKKLFKAK